MVTRRTFFAVAVFAAMSAATAQAAPNFPQKPVHIVVPNPPGGASDVAARLVAAKLSEKWGQSVIVENRPGAGGSIGTQYVARQSNDGTTLLMGGIASHAINPALYSNLPYDPVADFTPVTLVGTLSNVLLAHPSFPASNVQELIESARKEPGKHMYASVGNGTSPHLSGALFEQLAGVQMVHVPYAGSAAALNDLLGGQVKLGFDNLSAGLPMIKSGKLKALAVTTPQRSPLLPDVPTMSEAGVPGYAVTSWTGLMAPAGLDPEIATFISKSVEEVLSEQDVKDQLLTLGIIAKSTTPQEFSEFLQAEVDKYRELAKKANLKIG